MGTMKSLLAATDFSDDARNAVRRAALLAAEQRAQLTLLHVMNSPSLEALRQFHVSDQAREKLVSDAGRMLNEWAAELAGMFQSVPTVRVQVGRVQDEILSASEQADLLVLGARGWNPLHDALLGTTAERLLRKSLRPVLVTKRAPAEAYRRVLVPVDFSPCSAAALEMALRTVPKASIVIAHAFEVPFESRLRQAGVTEDEFQEYRIQARQQALNDIDLLIKKTIGDDQQCSRVVEHGAAAPLILAKEAEHDADLIVIGKHGRSAVEEMLLGSVTRHILADANCDVLVVHEQPSSR